MKNIVRYLNGIRCACLCVCVCVCARADDFGVAFSGA
jgi:hypothetical protein